MNNYKPYTAAFCYSFLVGLSFLITKLIVQQASGNLILAHRFTVSLISLLVFSIITGKKIKLTKQKLLQLLPILIFYPTLFFSLQVFGLQYGSSSEAGIIFATVPIITVLITAIMGTLPTKTQIVSILLSVSGVITIFSSNLKFGNGLQIGFILLFLSAISFSIYTIIVKRVLKEVTIYELTSFIIIIGFLVFNTLFAYEQTSIKTAFESYISPFYNLDYLLGIFYLGFFASVVSSYSSNYALQYINASQFSVFSNLSTLISIIAGAVILSEPLYIQHYIGITLILAGVIGANFAPTFESRLKTLKKILN